MNRKNSFCLPKKIILFFLIFFVLYQCKPKQQPPQVAAVQRDISLKLNCVVLERSLLERWIDSITPLPGNQIIRGVLLQVYSDNVGQAESNNSVIAYGIGTHIDMKTKGTVLPIVQGCTSQPISGTIAVSSNYINLVDNGIVKNNGELVTDFASVTFTPRQPAADTLYVLYDAEIFSNKLGTKTLVGKTITYPCPKYCNDGLN